MMKKFAALVFCMVLLACSVSAYQNGDVVNTTLHTDIGAYINYYPIQSYNINGSTAILVEDLAYYGMDVTWDGQARTLSVERGDKTEITPPRNVFKSALKPGTPAYPVYYTDIRTFVGGVEVESYNIGGYTIMYIDDLAAFGVPKWYSQERVIVVRIEDLPKCEFKLLETEPQYDTYVNTEFPTFEAVTGASLAGESYKSGVVSYHYAYDGEAVQTYIEALRYINFDVKLEDRGETINYQFKRNGKNFAASANAEKGTFIVATIDGGKLPMTYYGKTAVPNYTSVTGAECRRTLYFDDKIASLNYYSEDGLGFIYTYDATEMERYFSYVRRNGFSVSEPEQQTTGEITYTVSNGTTVFYVVVNTGAKTWQLCVKLI